jgi:2,4-dienoyl-CoA reductase-like NADH-dependent reductase (Old Yellow Enzyme family)
VSQPINHLFAPLKLRSLTLPNRIAVSPMCEYSSIDGFANDWHFVHLGSRAIGGAALIITEANSVSPEARITPSDLGIWSDDHIPELKRITIFLHQHGAYAGTQLAHAGRKASMSVPWEQNRTIPQSEGGWQPVAPSAIRFDEAYPIPAALDRAGMDKIIADFIAATHRALAAGFDLVEVHAAHPSLTTAPTSTAAASTTAFASPSKSSAQSAPRGPSTCRSSSASPPPTGPPNPSAQAGTSLNPQPSPNF